MGKLETVVGSTTAGEEQGAGACGPTVQGDVANSELGRHVGQDIDQSGCQVRKAPRPAHFAGATNGAAALGGLKSFVHVGRHGSAAVRTPALVGAGTMSSGALIGRSGSIASSRNAPPTTAEKTGAETSPP